jgi:hypothetical protein
MGHCWHRTRAAVRDMCSTGCASAVRGSMQRYEAEGCKYIYTLYLLQLKSPICPKPVTTILQRYMNLQTRLGTCALAQYPLGTPRLDVGCTWLQDRPAPLADHTDHKNDCQISCMQRYAHACVALEI